MNLQSEKKHHEIKLAIIKMIEECDERIREEEIRQERYRTNCYDFFAQSKLNIYRYEKIKSYLLERYKR